VLAGAILPNAASEAKCRVPVPALPGGCAQGHSACPLLLYAGSSSMDAGAGDSCVADATVTASD